MPLCDIGLIKKEVQKGGTAMMQVRSAQNIEQAMEVLGHASAMNPADTLTLLHWSRRMILRRMLASVL